VPWQDRLRPASYRDVPFFMPATGRRGGRRIVTHQFIDRNDPDFDDLGRKVRRLRVDAFVLGEDYDQVADRLEIACEREGRGILSHPHYGRLSVICKDYERRDSLERDGGLARFTIDFEQAERVPERDPRPDVPRQIDDIGAQLETAAAASLVEDVVVSGPEFLRNAISNAMTQVTTALNALDVFSGPASEVAAFQAGVTGIINRLGSLVTAPLDLALDTLGVLGSIEDAAGNALSSLLAYQQLLDLNPVLGLGESALEVQANANASAVIELVRRGAARGAVKAASEVAWASFEDAIEARDLLQERLESMLLVADDNSYQQLMNLSEILTRAVPPADEDLPRVTTFEPRASIPAVLLAYRLYDDVDRDGDIVDRNRVRNPAFLPPEPLEVLSG